MSQRDDDRFRIQPGAPKQRGDAFINKVLRQTNRSGAKLGTAAGKVRSASDLVLGWGAVTSRRASPVAD